MRKEIRISGFGGQGIVLAGVVLGRAAAVYEGYNAVQTQSYGPEARGGASRSDVIVSDEEVMYPYVRRPDFLVTMSQEAYEKYVENVPEDGLVVYDSTLVNPSREDVEHVGIPATDLAEEKLGLSIVANMIILGALRELTGIVSFDSLQKAVEDSVPPGTEDVNVRALKLGAREVRE
ncbi:MULTISPECIES: 2-oxoacid:ferredoxin oxidoreductase subunit gamma [unclassified Methanopyrus]|uniref:2-oxoacid:ferredoxin oxidoreductase subunit gamma n=1 Tax=unclassified Methanopyrus TaxID=2684913 RepID=UPI000B4B8499|nr:MULTISPECIES: 2-oxoacid:ferredoxin oxidoreductase subunit gamma [unclassified Methanopyrus]